MTTDDKPTPTLANVSLLSLSFFFFYLSSTVPRPFLYLSSTFPLPLLFLSSSSPLPRLLPQCVQRINHRNRMAERPVTTPSGDGGKIIHTPGVGFVPKERYGEVWRGDREERTEKGRRRDRGDEMRRWVSGRNTYSILGILNQRNRNRD